MWISCRLHFHHYTNDILKTINRKSKPVLLADDISNIFTNSNLKDFTNYIKIEFVSLTTWSKVNRLSLHFYETYFTQFTTKNSPQIDLYLSCAKNLISKACETTFLGTYVDYTVLENSFWTNGTQINRSFLCNGIS